MILRLDNDSGIIKIGSPPEDLPGILESINISDSLLIENTGVQGRSGKVKIIQGWDDVDLQITLYLIDNPRGRQTRFDYLKIITGIFKKVGEGGKPEVYTLCHPMINAWNTKQFVISSLRTSESRNRRKINVTIEFLEHDSFSGVIQERQSPNDTSSAAEIEPAPLISDERRRDLERMERRYAQL
jgi:hypothetical protein